MTDRVRKNRPSASYMELYAKCPGAFLLGQQVSEEEKARQATEASEAGQRIHLADQESDLGLLEDISEQELLKRIRFNEEQIVLAWLNEFGENIHGVEIYRERRLWSEGELYSGQIDLLVVAPKRKAALVADAKSGRQPVPPPVRNHQLRTAVALVAAHWDIQHARTAIIQPFVAAQPACDYTFDDVRSALREVDGIVAACDDPNAPRRPGPHCGRCSARAICPEAKKRDSDLLSLRGLRWEAIPIQQKIDSWIAWKEIIEPVGKQICENMKAELVQNPEAFCGTLVLTKTTQVRRITDALETHKMLCSSDGFGSRREIAEAFNAMCKVSVGSLCDFIAKKQGLSKDQASAWLNRLFADMLVLEPKEGHVTKGKQP